MSTKYHQDTMRIIISLQKEQGRLQKMLKEVEEVWERNHMDLSPSAHIMLLGQFHELNDALRRLTNILKEYTQYLDVLSKG